MSGLQLQTATAGRWHGEVPAMVRGVCSDTRRLQPGDAFLALRGPNFDGHAFAGEAAGRGAVALIGDSAGMLGWKDIALPQLEVSDGLLALGSIACHWRASMNVPVLAVTGSFGKTTLRSMLEHVLVSRGLAVTATRANDNNLIGVPQTLLRIQPDDAAAVIECGISEPGEMVRLAAMVQPDAAVITGIAAAHAEGLGSMAGVAAEKALLLDALRPGGVAVLGPGVSALLGERAMPADTMLIDMDGDGAVRWEMSGCRVRLACAGEQTEFDVALPAGHWAADAAIAATVLIRLKLATLAGVGEALGSWQPVGGRMRQIAGTGGYRILDDSYNANPASMQAAIDTLRRLSGRRIAVLGDMAELGTDSAALHAALDVEGLDAVLLVGEQMRNLARATGAAQWMPGIDEAVNVLRGMQLESGDTLLVKGSRFMKMERVVRALAEANDAV